MTPTQEMVDRRLDELVKDSPYPVNTRLPPSYARYLLTFCDEFIFGPHDHNIAVLVPYVEDWMRRTMLKTAKPDELTLAEEQLKHVEGQMKGSNSDHLREALDHVIKHLRLKE